MNTVIGTYAIVFLLVAFVVMALGNIANRKEIDRALETIYESIDEAEVEIATLSSSQGRTDSTLNVANKLFSEKVAALRSEFEQFKTKQSLIECLATNNRKAIDDLLVAFGKHVCSYDQQFSAITKELNILDLDTLGFLRADQVADFALRHLQRHRLGVEL